MLVLVDGCDALTSTLKVGVGSNLCFEIITEVSSSNEIERRQSCMELIIKNTKPKSVVAEEWEKAIKYLANSLVFETTHNRCLNNDVPRELEKHNESYAMSEETKIFEGPIGREGDQLHAFTSLVEGAFAYSSCESACSKNCSFYPKEKNESRKTCLRFKRNIMYGNDESSSEN